MLFLLSYFPETVLTFCPLTWESCLNLLIAVAYRFVVEFYVVFSTYFTVLRESLLQHASRNFLIGSQVSHLMSLRHCCSIFFLERDLFLFASFFLVLLF